MSDRVSESELYDCIVVGLGGHGSAAVAHLASRFVGLPSKRRILGIEKFARAHANGSSHGRSRIIRQAYFEDPKYVPLLQRAFELWRQLAEFEKQHGLNINPSNESINGNIVNK